MPIEGVLNFRAVTGLTGADGRAVRPGRLFRSGSYAAITPAGIGQVQGLGITRVFDLRSRYEQNRFGFASLQAAGIGLGGHPHDLDLGDLTAVLRDTAPTPAAVRQAMLAIYRKLPRHFLPVYRDFFALCLTAPDPVAVNCSVGKDRTGVAVALLLSALGVPRDAIMAEYDLTNRQHDAILHNLRHRPGANRYAKLSDTALSQVAGASPDYLAAMFATVEAEAGSAADFVVNDLGIGSAGLAALRDCFLQP